MPKHLLWNMDLVYGLWTADAPPLAQHSTRACRLMCSSPIASTAAVFELRDAGVEFMCWYALWDGLCTPPAAVNPSLLDFASCFVHRRSQMSQSMLAATAAPRRLVGVWLSCKLGSGYNSPAGGKPGVRQQGCPCASAPPMEMCTRSRSRGWSTCLNSFACCSRRCIRWHRERLGASN
jgi:hypothetical protein